MTTSVLIADRHPAFRHDLALYLEFLDAAYDPVAAVGTAGEALARIAARVPDIVLVDLDLPDMGGLRLVRRITAAWPDLAVLVVGNYPAGEYRGAALAAGARAYVDKLDLVNELPWVLRDLPRRPLRSASPDHRRSSLGSPAGGERAPGDEDPLAG